MNFKEAKTKLAKIADGEYHSIRYVLKDYGDGNLEQECGIYIYGMDWHLKPTWDKAFESLLGETKQPEIEDIPEIANAENV